MLKSTRFSTKRVAYSDMPSFSSQSTIRCIARTSVYRPDLTRLPFPMAKGAGRGWRQITKAASAAGEIVLACHSAVLGCRPETESRHLRQMERKIRAVQSSHSRNDASFQFQKKQLKS